MDTPTRINLVKALGRCNAELSALYMTAAEETQRQAEDYFDLVTRLHAAETTDRIEALIEEFHALNKVCSIRSEGITLGLKRITFNLESCNT
jgi:hypothetical protein